MVPSLNGLKRFEILVQQSPVGAVDLGDEAAAFFSKACGKDTRLAFIEPAKFRKVLGTLSQGVDKYVPSPR